MSNSVADFFSKSGVKKFKNGVKAFADKQAVRIVASSMVLAGAFATTAKAQSFTQDRPQTVTAYAITEKGDTLCAYKAIPTDSISFDRLQKMVNNATKSKTGCEVLKKISEQGTTLTVDDAGQGTVGYFSPSDNAICLNKRFDNGNLQSCLIHEGKHSVQSAALDNGANAFNNFATNTLISRVMEADAVATQTKFSYEMAQVGDSIAWKSLQKSHGGITETFEKNAKKYGQDDKKTMKETMLAWYDDKPYVLLYDQGMVDFHARVVTKAPDSMIKDCFTGGVNPDKVIQAVCTMGDKKYAGKDGSILLTPRTAYLDREIFAATEAISEFYKTRTENVDQSATVHFYPLNANGTVSDKTFAQERQEEQIKAKQEAAKIAVAVVKKAQSR